MPELSLTLFKIAATLLVLAALAPVGGFAFKQADKEVATPDDVVPSRGKTMGIVLALLTAAAASGAGGLLVWLWN
jgi:hypothetical protein